MNAGATVATIVAAKQQQYLRCFREGRATGPGSAKFLDELGLRPDGVFRSMVERGVVVEASSDTYYLDVEAAEAWASERRTAVSIMMVLLVVVVVAILVLRLI